MKLLNADDVLRLLRAYRAAIPRGSVTDEELFDAIAALPAAQPEQGEPQASDPLPQWEPAKCPKCGTLYTWEGPDEPGPDGWFCPTCKERGYMLLGVLHFTKRATPPADALEEARQTIAALKAGCEQWQIGAQEAQRKADEARELLRLAAPWLTVSPDADILYERIRAWLDAP